jgi:hypothetical protein
VLFFGLGIGLVLIRARVMVTPKLVLWL